MSVVELQEKAGYEAARAGSGNWEAWTLPLDTITTAATRWREALAGVERPWLCWNVSDRWCLLQQRLVQEVGWTPVVGFDPRVGPPPLAPGAVLIDFNRDFGFPVMKPHFPLEFAYLYCDRLATWHSDLLCRLDVMQHLARTFERLKDGEMAAVKEGQGWRGDRHKRRYWELVTCTTAGASAHQWACGSGWWRHIEHHPACQDPDESARREALWYEFGRGILYWEEQYGGRVIALDQRPIEEGHCTSIGNPSYRRATAKNALRAMGGDLDANYDLDEVAAKLGIAHLF